MAAPIYIVSYDGTQVPGYVQAEDLPIALGSNTEKFFGRDGGINTPTGANFRQISLDFILISTLGDATGLQHLDNINTQFRSAAAILTRPYGENPLVIHDTDRYWMAKVDKVSAPRQAGTTHRTWKYNVQFTSQPWALSTVAASDTFTGNGAVSLAGMTGSRRSYPSFSIPSTVDTFTAVDEHGHTIEFDRQGSSNTMVVDCATLEVYRPANSLPAMHTMLDLNFAMYWEPSDGDTMEITVTNWSGSGTVTVTMPKRYEL